MFEAPPKVLMSKAILCAVVLGAVLGGTSLVSYITTITKYCSRILTI
jgi:hypothetical protein